MGTRMMLCAVALSLVGCKSGDPAGTFAAEGTNLVIAHQDGDKYSLKFLSVENDILMVGTRTGRILSAQTGLAEVTVEFSEDWNAAIVRMLNDTREFRRLSPEEAETKLKDLAKAKEERPGAACPLRMVDRRVRCAGKVTDEDIYTWTVSKPGKYVLTVYAPAKRVAFDPGLIVTDSTGAELARVAGGIGSNAMTTVEVKAGIYKLKIYPADGFNVKGGYSYEFEIERVP